MGGVLQIYHGCLVRRFNDEYDLNYFEYSSLVFVYRYAIVNQLTWARAFHSCHRFGKRRSESNTSPVQRERHVVCVENNVRRMLWKYKHNIQLRAAECCIIYIDVQAAGTFLVTLHNYTGRQLKAVNGSCNSATPQAHVSFILTLFFVKFLPSQNEIARKKSVLTGNWGPLLKSHFRKVGQSWSNSVTSDGVFLYLKSLSPDL